MVVQENNEVYIVENKDDATLSTVAARSIVSTSEKSVARLRVQRPNQQEKQNKEQKFVSWQFKVFKKLPLLLFPERKRPT